MLTDDEPLANLKTTALRIGVCTNYLRAVLKAMGRPGQVFFDSEITKTVKKWIVDHPQFRAKTGLPATPNPGEQFAGATFLHQQVEAAYKSGGSLPKRGSRASSNTARVKLRS